MSTLIAAEGLGHGYHDEWLFKNLTLGINSGQRVALVGINGAGKSTLLKLLAERFPPLEGKIVKNTCNLFLAQLNFSGPLENINTLWQYLFLQLK